ncbi:hypothetical protein [Catenuloplanes indicus]|uniref:Uncharacterized protein n=1 Tax=Catenuloplanes indicus TaxID=137267 RepID=A0AAE3VX22_9ACTN|nr:hypothetical protein [Catenuloplanes indicus]MDQ0365289.1 hypothetical protein [Catenuloplanes indicus]
MSSPEPAEPAARAGQSFWSVVVGVPAIFSVLRLGVEAGGELQTTLLLVANVDPINLIAALFTTAARFVSATLVGVLAIGGVALAGHTPDQGRLPLFARWLRAAPLWFAVAAFGLAAITWQIMYLPLLLPCAVAAFQSIVTVPRESRRTVAAVAVAGVVAYGWLVGPTVAAAAGQGAWLVCTLFVAPPLLAPGVRGPLPRRFVGVLTVLAQSVALIMVVTAAVPMITTPVLPLTVTTVLRADPADAASPAGARETEDILGHVITVDDVHMVILQESGGVRYVPTGLVRAQVLCPTEGELPRYRLWVRGFHVEDSLLEGLGRQVRPASRLDAACRNPVAG